MHLDQFESGDAPHGPPGSCRRKYDKNGGLLFSGLLVRS